MIKAFTIAAVPLLLAAPALAQKNIIIVDADSAPRQEQSRPAATANRTGTGDSPIQASVLLKTGNGQRQANVQDTFFDGQRFRLRVASNLDGYLYALCLNSQGNAMLLFPNNQDEPANHVARNRRVTIPENNAWFQFDNEPGAERIFLVLSERPLPELERASQNGGELDRRLLDRYARSNSGGASSASKGIGVANDDGTEFVVRRLDLLHEQRDWR